MIHEDRRAYHLWILAIKVARYVLAIGQVTQDEEDLASSANFAESGRRK